ncbi:MAG: hypothetical protein A2Y12_18915 [Planctomycetes bacterium GWF2_42_9]|nr:MAG: hypothetical protein A2Y12_18915 [Planctomycetes bacterium GWF2_42_9]
MKIKMMKIILFLLAVFCFLSGGCGKKASEKKVYRVGILSGLNLFSGIANSFKENMKELGYIEGQNIIYDTQKTNFERDREKQILRKFVDDKVDLIFGFNTEVALEAKEITKGTDIPVIFANAILEGINLVNNTKLPGGNMTGVRYPSPDVAVKRLEIMHEMIPQAKRIWLPYQKGYSSVPAELSVLQKSLSYLDVNLIPFPAENIEHLQAELQRRNDLKDIGFDAVLLIPESLSTTRECFDVIAKYTRDRKIPIGGSFVTTEDYGTVFAVTINNKEIGKRAAYLCDKVLKGEAAGNIPVVTPELHLKVNYKIAKQLGLDVPEGLLCVADEIIR